MISTRSMREPNQALTLVALEPALGSPKRNALVMCHTLQGHALFEHRAQLIKPLQCTLPLGLAQSDETAPAARLDVALTCVHSEPSLRHRALKKLRHSIPKVTTAFLPFSEE